MSTQSRPSYSIHALTFLLLGYDTCNVFYWMLYPNCKSCMHACMQDLLCTHAYNDMFVLWNSELCTTCSFIWILFWGWSEYWIPVVIDHHNINNNIHFSARVQSIASKYWLLLNYHPTCQVRYALYTGSNVKACTRIHSYTHHVTWLFLTTIIMVVVIHELQ